MTRSLDIAVAGAGVGGLTCALALMAQGHQVTVYEQAAGFSHVGADINLTPNAVRTLDGLGLGAGIRRTAARPTFRISRDWDTGRETSRLVMGDTAEQRYGSPQLTIHRAELLNVLAQAFPAHQIHFSKRLHQLEVLPHQSTLLFADGTQTSHQVVIGADGIHSKVRAALFGDDRPRFTQVVSYRAVVPTLRVQHLPDVGAFTKWWGPQSDSQIVTFPLNQGQDTFVFATTGQEDWLEESWTSAGDVEELRSHYQAYHPDARALLDACDSVLKSALYERYPMPHWTQDQVALLGDACHPMLPFMAQGAGMALEDAIVLSRCLSSDTASISQALLRYQHTRSERTDRIQIGSRGNQWMKTQGNADWVYGYDAWQTPLAD